MYSKVQYSTIQKLFCRIRCVATKYIYVLNSIAGSDCIFRMSYLGVIHSARVGDSIATRSNKPQSTTNNERRGRKLKYFEGLLCTCGKITRGMATGGRYTYFTV